MWPVCLLDVWSDSMASEFDLCLISGDDSPRNRFRVMRRMDAWMDTGKQERMRMSCIYFGGLFVPQ